MYMMNVLFAFVLVMLYHLFLWQLDAYIYLDRDLEERSAYITNPDNLVLLLVTRDLIAE